MSAYLAPGLWAALIVWLSVGHIPATPEPLAWLSPDKLGHLCFYAILAALLCRAEYKRSGQARPVLSFSLSFGLGLILEYIQALLPHRSFDYADMTANGLGALLGLGAWQYRMRFIQASSKR